MKPVRLISFFKFPILVFALGLALRPLNAYQLFPWVDIPMHLLGGAAIAHTFILIFNHWQTKNLIQIKSRPVKIFLIISTVALFANFYEIWEFLMTAITGNSWQGTLQDTIADLFTGLIGGLAIAIFDKS
jgi:hypothetical protein